MSTSENFTSAAFGPYRLMYRIGVGGMAEVYAARRLDNDALVAIKRLLPKLAEDPAVVRMFVNEGHIAAQIHHPNVVRVVEVDDADGTPFIAMELLEGHSFAELRSQAALTGTRVPLPITLRILTEACRGLEAAHQAKDDTGQLLCVAHRDFTPENIHVGVTGDIKLLDFGIAKSSSLGTGTEPGTLKGKFFYMAPEMVAGRPVDQRADIFAAGVMLYEQLCGRRPFTGVDKNEVMLHIARGNPKRPSEFDPSVPRALEEVCLLAIDKEPERRFLQVADFVAAILATASNELASANAVGAYVAQLFPLANDERRQQVLRARLGTAPFEPEAAAAEPQSPAKQPDSVRRRAPLHLPRGWRLGLPLLVLVAVGIGTAWRILENESAQGARQRLMAAEKTSVPTQREALLIPLAADPEATLTELDRAGELLLRVSANDAALRMAETMVSRFPKDLRGQVLMARACIRLRYGKRAEEAIEKARALAPGDGRPHAALAELMEAQGKVGDALEALRQALSKDDTRWEWQAQYGTLLSRTGDLEGAADALTKSLQRHFDSKTATELGAVRLRQQQVRNALLWLRRAVRQAPHSYEAQYYLAAALFAAGDISGSERAYEEADALNPKDARALVGLCQLKIKTNDETGMQKVVARLSARFPAQANELKGQCER